MVNAPISNTGDSKIHVAPTDRTTDPKYDKMTDKNDQQQQHQEHDRQQQQQQPDSMNRPTARQYDPTDRPTDEPTDRKYNKNGRQQQQQEQELQMTDERHLSTLINVTIRIYICGR